MSLHKLIINGLKTGLMIRNILGVSSEDEIQKAVLAEQTNLPHAFKGADLIEVVKVTHTVDNNGKLQPIDQNLLFVSSEVSKTDNELSINLNRDEQKRLFDTFYSLLNKYAEQEIYEKEPCTSYCNAIRPIFRKLIKGLNETFDPIHAVFLGLPEFIPNDLLEKWAISEKKPEELDQIQWSRAKWLYNKSQEQEFLDVCSMTD